MNTPEIDNDKREKLRERARSLVNFKVHFIVFILSNLLIWIIWLFLFYAFQVSQLWAVFPTMIWLILLIFHYLWVYRWNATQVEKEYNRLVKKMIAEKNEKNKQEKNNN